MNIIFSSIFSVLTFTVILISGFSLLAPLSAIISYSLVRQ